MSSRLFQEVREKRGLAYSVFSFASCYADTGVLGIYAGTGEKETEELVPVVCDQILELIDQPAEEELIRARAQLKASLMMALESCFAQSEDLARQLLIFGRRMPPDEIIAKIDAVDEEFQSTPLGLAARFGKAEMIAFLLDRGADPTKAGAPWATPVAWAEAKGHAAIAERLRSAGGR